MTRSGTSGLKDSLVEEFAIAEARSVATAIARATAISQGERETRRLPDLARRCVPEGRASAPGEEGT